MKNLLTSIIAVVAMAMVSSCQSYNTGTYSYYSSEKTENAADLIEQDGFIVKMVKSGDTLWEYSEGVYGTGYKWEEILRENPHLVGRLSYDKDRKISIVTIYPGETIRVGGKFCQPSFSTCSDTTKTISSSYRNEKGVSVAWWAWVIPSLLILLIAVGILWLRYATRHTRAREKEKEDQNRLIKQAMISNYGKKVHVSWTENSFEIS